MELYAKIFHRRGKGQKITSDVTKRLIKSGNDYNQKLKLTPAKLSLITQRAKRIERLLNLAGDNYNIIDAFPDLSVNLFSPSYMSTYNYERWLKLIKTNNLISVDEGKRLYAEYKEQSKRERSETLKNIYIGANKEYPHDDHDDDVEEEEEEVVERGDLIF